MVRPVRELARTIQDQDVKMLATYPGIGEATAERIVAKLRRKVGKFALIVSPAAAAEARAAEANGHAENAEPDVIRDTYAALLSVGHTESQARQAIDRVLAGKKKFKSVADMIDAIYQQTSIGAIEVVTLEPVSRVESKPRGRGPMREPIIKGRAGRAHRIDTAAGRGRPADPLDEKLRPQRLAEVIGQRSVAERLAIALEAAKKRGEPLPHILFDGPPGLGKTTFATVLHNELGVELNITSGPALDKKMDVMPYLTNASEGSILFIDEIHRLPKTVEEFIYPVMEDFRVDVVLGEGMSAADDQPAAQEVHDHRRHHPQRHALRPAPRPLPHARAPGVLRRRRPGPDHRGQRREAPDDDHRPRPRWELAQRSRGTPRLANARLRWVRDYATARADGQITLPIARDALDMQEVDTEGLDKQDRRYLETLIRVFQGGPTGAEAISARP